MDALYYDETRTGENLGKNASTIQFELQLHSTDRRAAETSPSRVPLAIDAAHPVVGPLCCYITDRERVIKMDAAKHVDDSLFSSAALSFQLSADALATLLSEIRVSPWMRCVPDLDARHVKRRAAAFVTRLHMKSLRAHSGCDRVLYCVMAYNALTFAAEFIAGDLESKRVPRLSEVERVIRSHCADAMRMAVEIARDVKLSTFGVGEEAMSPMDIIACTACTLSFAKCVMGALSRMRETKSAPVWKISFRDFTSSFADNVDDDEQQNAALMEECRSQLSNAITIAHRYAHLAGDVDFDVYLTRARGLLEERVSSTVPNRDRLVPDFQEISAIWYHRLTIASIRKS
ncbi:hypothetical protein CYMTET_43227 [Cymbomonas tetramitiformis]|uniref:Uncharacterized protein n=1 Tax=Cymbomonas tetramitiformis TaxID=36881 RepID=A0AAE0F0H0_9CHLO|nr:hypothetical protein CYMTET_43227 [Cymbomonas tetramitiformis]